MSSLFLFWQTGSVGISLAVCRNNTQQTQTIVFSSAGWAYSKPCQKLSVCVLTRVQCGTNHNCGYTQTLVVLQQDLDPLVPQTIPKHTIRPWIVSKTISSQFVSWPAGLHSHGLLVHYPQPRAACSLSTAAGCLLIIQWLRSAIHAQTLHIYTSNYVSEW